MGRLSWTIILLSIAHLGSGQKRCYYPNGSEATIDYPCDPDAEDSACCAGGFGTVCLTNKLCRNPNGNVIRGSCTDKNWSSPECAHYCLGARLGGHDLISCANVTGTDTSYCCDGHRAYCCDDGVARFEVLPPRPEVWATWDRESSGFVVVKRREATSSSTSSPPASSSPTTPTTTTESTAPPARTSPDQSTNPLVTSPSLPVAAQAGIGVGVGVVALLLAVVAYLLWKLRRDRLALAGRERGGGNEGDAHGQVQDSVMKADMAGLPPQSWYHAYRTGPPAELPLEMDRHEMDGRGPLEHVARAELPAHRVQ